MKYYVNQLKGVMQQKNWNQQNIVNVKMSIRWQRQSELLLLLISSFQLMD